MKVSDSFTPRYRFTHLKTPFYSLNMRPGGPESWSGCFGEEKSLGTLRVRI